MEINWLKIIEDNKETIEDKCSEAFEEAMNNANHNLEYTVVLEQDGSVRIDTGLSNEEASDVHFGEAKEIETFQYNPDWEDDWRNDLGNEAIENETEKEKEEHFQQHIQWYEIEIIPEKIDNLTERLKEDQKVMTNFMQI